MTDLFIDDGPEAVKENFRRLRLQVGNNPDADFSAVNRRLVALEAAVAARRELATHSATVNLFPNRWAIAYNGSRDILGYTIFSPSGEDVTTGIEKRFQSGVFSVRAKIGLSVRVRFILS